MGKDITSEEGRAFTLEILEFMRSRLLKYQEETGNYYNLEATPAEGTSYRLARIDREKYPEIKAMGGNEPYYTNSTQLPVSHTDDVFEALGHQDEIQCKYTGGTVFHVFLGERLDSGKAAKSMVRKISENFHLPYYSLTPTFSVCPVHGYLSGEHMECPLCKSGRENVIRHEIERLREKIKA